MLSLPFHRRHLRRTVWMTLSAWVLALLAGTANACQLEPHAPVAAPATSAQHHDGHSAPDGPTTDPGKGACLKFCDDESSTVAKGTTPQPDLPGPVGVAGVAWHSAISNPTAAVVLWRPIERPASQGPPLVIRFLRLTI